MKPCPPVVQRPAPRFRNGLHSESNPATDGNADEIWELRNCTAAFASTGDAQAHFILGAMYAKGQGVPQDYTDAAKWYRLTADRTAAGRESR